MDLLSIIITSTLITCSNKLKDLLSIYQVQYKVKDLLNILQVH